MNAPAFSAEFQERLRLDRYTAWAQTLTAEHLKSLLWFSAEFGGGGHCMLDLFDQYPEICLCSPKESHNIRMRLECISNFCHGDRFDLAEAKSRFVQGRSRMGIADLPDMMRNAVTKAAPDVKWDYVSMSEYGYELCGKDISDKECSARVSFAGEFTFRTLLNTSEMPKTVIIAFRYFLDSRLEMWGYGIGVQPNNFERYEIRIRLQDYSLRNFEVSADGRIFRPPIRDGKHEMLFSEAFRKELDIGKYRFASALSEASLEGLLWILGAVATETLPALRPISALVDLESWPDASVLRPRIALDGIFRVVVHEERYDVDQVMRSGWDQWRRACRKAIPINVRRAVDTVVPTSKWTYRGCDKSAEEYTVYGKDETGRRFTVSVSHDDNRVVVEVVASISEFEVPRDIRAVLKARLPELAGRPMFPLTEIEAIGASFQAVDHYKFSVDLSNGGRGRIVISADGKKVEVRQLY